MKERRHDFVPPRPLSTSRATSFNIWTKLLAALSLICLVWYRWSSQSSAFLSDSKVEWKWSEVRLLDILVRDGSTDLRQIAPSTDLQWHSCYEDRYECARLE